MTLPNPMTKQHMDLGTDDPRQARDEFADNVDLFNALLVHLALSSLTSTPATVGEGLEIIAGALRAQLNGATLLRSGSGLSVNTGSGANQIVQRDGSGNLPITAATVAEWRSGVATALLNAKIPWDAMAEVALTFAATVGVNMASGMDFVLTMTGNAALGNPTNVKVGQRGRIRIVQDGAGSRTLTYGTSYEFEVGAAPTLTTTAAAQDVLYYDCISATRILCFLVSDIV